MNRVEAAIQEGRCVLAIGGRALQNPDVLAELRRRTAIPQVVLGGDPLEPAKALSAEALAPAFEKGGVLVLVEPEGGTDGRALGELDKLIKGAKTTPRLVVAARAYNPFSMPMGMRLMKTDHEKARAQDFLSTLPVPTVAVAAAAPAAPAEEEQDDRHRAARPDLVDRTEEQAQLLGWLSEEGGPVVVSGPPGIGRRWLVESTMRQHAEATEGDLVRIPDLTFARGSGVDALLGRLAVAARMGGDERLHDALRGKTVPRPADLAALVVEVAQGESLDGAVLVLHELDHLLDKRNGSFYREGRLELVLAALLTAPLKLRLIFTTSLQPEFHAEGQAQHIRRLRLKGIPGKELHELFELWHAPEFDRDRFGPIAERIHGHPMAARAMAIAARDVPIDELLDQPRYLKANSLDDVGPLARNLKRRVEKLDGEKRAALEAVACLREPGTPEELHAVDIKRDLRIDLQASGMLEQVRTPAGRRYYVHPLVRQHLDRRKVEDFGRMEMLGNHYLDRSRHHRKAGEDALSIALAYEANRLLVGARRARSRIRLPYPDLDATLDDLYGLMRRRQARLDIARMRVVESLKHEPHVPELLLAQAELLVGEKAKVEEVQAVFDKVMTDCPTPEAAHQEATWHLRRNSRGKAVEALQRGAATFPGNARIRRRLAGLLVEMNQLEDAVTVLKEARDLEPMMPDSYSMLGELYVQLGQEHWEDASTVLQEALELAPEDPQHQTRYAALLRARGAADPEQRTALWEEAENVARKAYEANPKDHRAGLRLVEIMLDRTAALDETRLDQAEYILKPLMKAKRPEPEALVQRARVLLRKEQYRDAQDLLEKSLRKAPGLGEAFMARGELWEVQVQPFHALEAWKAARERTLPGTSGRMIADEGIARLQSLIESGMAVKMMSEKGVDAAPDPEHAGATPKQVQQRIKRRKAADKGSEDKPAEGEAPAEDKPAEGPSKAEDTPAEGQAQAEGKPTEDKPAAEKAEDEPAAEKAEDKPAVDQAEDKPAADQADEAPAQEEATEAPASDAQAPELKAAADAASAEAEAPLEDKPPEDKPPEDKPAEDKPAEDKPAE